MSPQRVSEKTHFLVSHSAAPDEYQSRELIAQHSKASVDGVQRKGEAANLCEHSSWWSPSSSFIGCLLNLNSLGILHLKSSTFCPLPDLFCSVKIRLFEKFAKQRYEPTVYSLLLKTGALPGIARLEGAPSKPADSKWLSFPINQLSTSWTHAFAFCTGITRWKVNVSL